MKKKVLVILGPTASGKSALGVKLAKKFRGEIISADSRQVYRGLDVGTGKITKREMQGIHHHLLDVASVKKQFSVSKYKKLAEEKVRYIVQKDKLPIVVGGTGFYIDALAGKVSLPAVAPNKALRKELSQKTARELFKILKKKDLKRAKTIDPNNKVRLIRALEIIKALGKVPDLKSDHKDNFIYIGLNPGDLDKRIRDRLEERLNGIIREARGLNKRGITFKRMNELGLEYRYASLHLEGKISKEEMLEKLYIEIKRYAKRQMTWFKRNKNIKWFKNPQDKELEKYVSNHIHF